MKRAYICILCMLLLSLTACTSEQPTPHPKVVVYSVTGVSVWKVNITITNSTGGTEQFIGETLPFTKRYEDFTGGNLYLSAQINTVIQENSDRIISPQWENKASPPKPSITATIYVNGEVYKTATSTGANAVAIVSGNKQ